MNIIFFGSDYIGTKILEALIKNDYKPLLVITSPPSKKGRGLKLQKNEIQILAEKENIKVSTPLKLRDEKFLNELRDLKPDLLVLASYGKIIPKEVLIIPKIGSLNVHPSLLPLWRGASPIQATIMAGDKKTGVTIMEMEEKLDTGKIILQEELVLTGNEYYLELREKLCDLAQEMIIKIIPLYADNKWRMANSKEQNDELATYTRIIKKEDGLLDFRYPSWFIERKIRALNGWPGTFVRIKNSELRIKLLKILKVRISDIKAEKGEFGKIIEINKNLVANGKFPRNSAPAPLDAKLFNRVNPRESALKEMYISCSDYLLEIQELQLEGKKTMSGEEFLRGHKDKFLISKF